MKEQIQTIIVKLNELIELDTKLKAHGAETHKYQLNPKLSEEQILSFEKKHNVKIPKGYRLFLKEIGNGGAGPYYGLYTLQKGIYEFDSTNDFITDLSQPFIHTNYWNIEFKEVAEEEWEEYLKEIAPMYWESKWTNGLLRISNFGCGVCMGLVVNGNEYGNIWVDDRANYNGIYPDPYDDQKEEQRTTFLDWYELWLDRNIYKFKQINKLKNTILKEMNSGKSCLQLREYIVLFKDSGGRMNDAYNVMNELRQNFGEQKKNKKKY